VASAEPAATLGKRLRDVETRRLAQAERGMQQVVAEAESLRAQVQHEQAKSLLHPGSHPWSRTHRL